jgi:hypothetical protein
MARAFAELEANPQSADLCHAEWLGLLLDREVTERYERRLRARLRYARLRHQASVEDVDYRAARGLDRSLFQAMIAAQSIEFLALRCGQAAVAPAGVTLRLCQPVPDRLCRRFELTRQLLRRAAGAHQVNHRAAELRRVGCSCLAHRGLLEPK